MPIINGFEVWFVKIRSTPEGGATCEEAGTVNISTSRMICVATAITLVGWAWAAPAEAVVSFNIGGAPIVGERQDFSPDATAAFTVSGNTLTMTVHYAGGQGLPVDSTGLALSSVFFDLGNFSGDLTAVSAMIATGSSLVGINAGSWTGGDDLSGQWTYRDDIAVSWGSNALGQYGASGVGDILFGLDTFGTADIIDSSKTLVTPVPNGIDFSIVPTATDLSKDGFKNNGPVVQDTIVLTFAFAGDTLSESDIMNVSALYGTDGAPLVPAPGAAVLAMIGIGLTIRRRRGSARGA